MVEPLVCLTTPYASGAVETVRNHPMCDMYICCLTPSYVRICSPSTRFLGLSGAREPPTQTSVTPSPREAHDSISGPGPNLE